LISSRVPLRTLLALRNYAIDLRRHCPGLPPVVKIHQDLLYSRSPLSSRKVNYNITCTGTGTKPCQIIKGLSTWNEFLWLINTELKELSPGKLGIVYQLGCRSRDVSDQRRQHACVVLHWLLQEHRCIETLELETTVIPMNHHLFCYALRLNSGLRRLKLSRYDLSGKVSEDVMAAIATMVRLEELELAWVSMPTGALKWLGVLIEQSQNLKKLVLHFMETTRGAAAHLVSGLKTNTSVMSLSLNDVCLRRDNGDVAFAEYLAQNSTLKELSIEVQVYGGAQSIGILLGALRTNRCLEKLWLFSGHLDAPEGDVLADVMVVNDTLRTLHVGDESSDTTFLAELIKWNVGLEELEIVTCSPWHFWPIGEAICKNTRLRTLIVHCSSTSIDDARPLLNAVAHSKTLEQLFLKNICESKLGEFCKVLQEMGIEGKVKYSSYISQPLIRVSTIDSSNRVLRDYYGPQDRLEPEVVLDGLCQLVCLSNIIQLTLKLDQDLDLDSATLLASFLSSSQKLKDIQFSFFTKDVSTRIIVEGLKSNCSVSNLILEDWNFSEMTAVLFGSYLRANKTLNYLTVLSSGAWAITQEMARSIVSNYFLLDFKTMELRDLENSMYHIKDILRRNVSLLHRALQFVMGSRLKMHAEAFELLYKSESLLRLMRDHVHGSEPDHRQKIRDGVQYLELNFMTLAGVVKKRVVCESLGKCQRLQLDGIGLGNWLKVRSYLKVSDVLDK
ncbi:unnamed protein product, partial [Ixodes hexagonus]